MSLFLVGMIRLYQLTLSRLLLALLGPVCRFEPSCSSYALACIRGHGALRGSLLSAKRLCRCHPFHPGGYDPPPAARSAESSPPQAQQGAAPPSQSLVGSSPPLDRPPLEPGLQ